MREVTLNFNGEDITIWAPNEHSASGLVEMLTERQGEPGGIFMISELAHEADMVEGEPCGAVKQALLDIEGELLLLESGQVPDSQECILDAEHAGALELWRNDVTMDDIHEHSLFTEYSGDSDDSIKEDNQGYKMLLLAGWKPGKGLGKQGEGITEPVAVLPTSVMRDKLGKPMNVTPDMLDQRDNLNWHFNFVWNREWEPLENMEVPDQHIEAEILFIGDNYAVGKCVFGGVYIPKGAVKHLKNIGSCEAGARVMAKLSFSGKRHPWWVNNITGIV
jgi:hypothetical protein